MLARRVSISTSYSLPAAFIEPTKACFWTENLLVDGWSLSAAAMRSRIAFPGTRLVTRYASTFHRGSAPLHQFAVHLGNLVVFLVLATRRLRGAIRPRNPFSTGPSALLVPSKLEPGRGCSPLFLFLRFSSIEKDRYLRDNWMQFQQEIMIGYGCFFIKNII